VPSRGFKSGACSKTQPLLQDFTPLVLLGEPALQMSPGTANLMTRNMSMIGGLEEQQTPVARGLGLSARFGVRSADESRKVGLFMLAAFLGNAFFVITRNVGTVLFLARIGPEYLTTAIFISGVSSVLVGQMFSSLSMGRSPALVNSWLLLISASLLFMFYCATFVTPAGLPDHLVGRVTVVTTFVGIYMVEDILAMFVAMQCASVAQAAFSVADAKRLFGLVQLGNSFAAMTVGIFIGSIAAAVGTEPLLAAQTGLLVLSLMLNVHIGRRYIDPSTSGCKKKKKTLAAQRGQGANEPWWKNYLILAMGLWSFTVIFTKTMYEYEYNVLIAGTMSADEMVALTGYLYACAGVVSTLINLVGTQLCLEKLGMRGAILATPATLLSVSIAILVNPSVTTTFLGRVADLSLRWSLNNTVRTVLWIAVPPQQAAAAKPWVEGTIKKMGQAFNAVVITVALMVSGGKLSSLSFLSLIFCTGLFVCCIRVYPLYLDSMWGRIKRRELQGEALPFDANIDMRVMDRLINGGHVTQIAILSQMAVNFSSLYWAEFFSRFYSLPAAVQVKILELGRKQRERVPDGFLLDLLGYTQIEPSVLQALWRLACPARLFGSPEAGCPSRCSRIHHQPWLVRRTGRHINCSLADPGNDAGRAPRRSDLDSGVASPFSRREVPPSAQRASLPTQPCTLLRMGLSVFSLEMKMRRSGNASHLADRRHHGQHGPLVGWALAVLSDCVGGHMVAVHQQSGLDRCSTWKTRVGIGGHPRLVQDLHTTYQERRGQRYTKAYGNANRVVGSRVSTVCGKLMHRSFQARRSSIVFQHACWVDPCTDFRSTVFGRMRAMRVAHRIHVCRFMSL